MNQLVDLLVICKQEDVASRARMCCCVCACRWVRVAKDYSRKVSLCWKLLRRT